MTVAESRSQRWLVAFRVIHDLRFISHRDTLRLFERALIRADLPVRYSEGFNPHPRLSILLPRPVGVASDEELMVVDFAEAVDRGQLLGALGPHLPAGVELTGARDLRPNERPRPESVRYRLAEVEMSQVDLASRIKEVLASSELTVERRRPGDPATRRFDARPGIQDISLTDGYLEFTLRVSDRGSVRPAELVGLLGLDPRAIQHKIRRLSIGLEGHDQRPQTLDEKTYGSLVSQRKDCHR